MTDTPPAAMHGTHGTNGMNGKGPYVLTAGAVAGAAVAFLTGKDASGVGQIAMAVSAGLTIVGTAGTWWLQNKRMQLDERRYEDTEARRRVQQLRDEEQALRTSWQEETHRLRTRLKEADDDARQLNEQFDALFTKYRQLEHRALALEGRTRLLTELLRANNIALPPEPA